MTLAGEALKLRGAGDPSMSETRRNKFLQSMAARKAGLPVAAQKLAKTLEEVDQFLVAERATLHITGSFMAVVKPCDGAGSEGVTVCKSEEQVLILTSTLTLTLTQPLPGGEGAAG